MHPLRNTAPRMLLIGLLCLPVGVAADESHPSHRLIETPHADLSNLQQQIEMLQRLQALINRARLQEQSAVHEQPGSETVEDLERLRQQVEELQGTRPEDLEKLRRLMERAGIQVPPGQRHQHSEVGGDVHPRQNLPEQRPRPQSDFMRSLLERFSDQPSGRNPAGRGTAGELSPPMFQDDFDDPARQERRDIADEARPAVRSRNDPSTPDNPFFNDTPPVDGPAGISPDWNIPEGLFGPGSRQGRNGNSGQSRPQPDWFEMLQRLSELDGGDSRNASRSPARRTFSSSGSPQPPSDSDFAESLSHAGDAASLEELQSNLKETWRSVVQQARRQSRETSVPEEDGPDGTESFGGMREFVLRAIEGLGGTILEQSRNRRSDQVSPAPLVTPSESKRSRSAIPGETMQRLNRFTRQANNWIADLSVPPSSPPTRSPSFPAPHVENVSIGESFSPIPLALLLVLLGLIVWILRNRLIPGAGDADVVGGEGSATSVRNRRDVVRAFHQLAGRSTAVRGNWWPHRRAAEALADAAPDRHDALLTLADLYERARYLPDETEFNEADLEAARGALQRCGVT